MSMLTLSNQPTMSTMPTTTLSTMTITTLPTPTVATLAVSHPNSTSIWVGRQQAKVTTLGAGFIRTDVYSVIDGDALWEAAYIHTNNRLWIVTPQETHLNDGQALWLVVDGKYELIGEFSFDDDDLLDDEEDLDDDQGSEAQDNEQSGGDTMDNFDFDEFVSNNPLKSAIAGFMAVAAIPMAAFGLSQTGLADRLTSSPKEEVKAEVGIKEVSSDISSANTLFDIDDVNVVESLENDYDVDVSKSKGSCYTPFGREVGGYYIPSAKFLCYSPAGDNSLQETRNQEAIHALQYQIGKDEVSDFVESSPYCEGHLPDDLRKKVEKLYPQSMWDVEKQGWALQDETACVKASLAYFDN